MKLTKRIILGYAFILVTFGLIVTINAKLSSSVVENTNFLIRSEGIIRNSAQYQRDIIDMENCFRGYMLSADKSFLLPYDSNARLVATLYDTLQSSTPDTSIQTNLLIDIKKLYEDWKLNFADPLIRAKMAGPDAHKNVVLKPGHISEKAISTVGKTITDLIRNKFSQFNTYEYRLREQRRETLRESIETTRRMSLILMLIGAVLSVVSMIFVIRVIMRRIREMVVSAGEIADGNFHVQINENERDEMDALSQALNRMAKKLSDNFTNLERKNADLNQFAHVVSHDLKAPLRGIEMVMNWIDEDTDSNKDPKVQEYHSIIRGRLKRMENLINGILDISRISRVQRPVERVDVKALLEEIIENLSPPRSFHIHIHEGMPVLQTEKILLQQVFTNLISNAIKYHHTQDGHIDIGVKERDKAFEFYVKDDGPGIDPEYHRKIFELFQTLKEKDAFESSGIGLAIVKKVIDEKGGIIIVDSIPGHGAAFTFTWPANNENIKKDINN